MDATIICIGDELLSGDITDLNSVWLAKQLTDNGVIVKRILVIPDDIDTIANEVKNASTCIVIVTGGLGPTHDDITRYGVAKAFGLPLDRPVEAVRVVEQRVKSRKPEIYVMADVPAGSEVIPNLVGAAPGFIVDGKVFVFPGVPSEMKAMFGIVRDRLKGERLLVDWVITKRPESDIVPVLNEAVRRFPEVSFGSYPSDVVKVKMRSYDAKAIKSAKEWLEQRIV